LKVCLFCILYDTIFLNNTIKVYAGGIFMVNPLPEAEETGQKSIIEEGLRDAAAPLVENGSATTNQVDDAIDATINSLKEPQITEQSKVDPDKASEEIRRALNLQNLSEGNDSNLGSNGGLKDMLGPDSQIMQMFVGFIAALTGQDPDDLMANIQEKMDKKLAGAKTDDPKNEDATPKADDSSPKTDAVANNDDDTSPKADDQEVAKNDATQESKQDVNTPEEDKGYVQGIGGGAATFDVASLTLGEPIANFDVGSMIFGDGNGAPSVFNGISNPDVSQISMVDPMVDMSATADTVEPPKNENVIGSMNF